MKKMRDKSHMLGSAAHFLVGQGSVSNLAFSQLKKLNIFYFFYSKIFKKISIISYDKMKKLTRILKAILLSVKNQKTKATLV